MLKGRKMDQGNHEDKYGDAINLLTEVLDGFLIAGYTAGGEERFIGCVSRDAACSDALEVPHNILAGWAMQDREADAEG